MQGDDSRATGAVVMPAPNFTIRSYDGEIVVSFDVVFSNMTIRFELGTEAAIVLGDKFAEARRAAIDANTANIAERRPQSK